MDGLPSIYLFEGSLQLCPSEVFQPLPPQGPRCPILAPEVGSETPAAACHQVTLHWYSPQALYLHTHAIPMHSGQLHGAGAAAAWHACIPAQTPAATEARSADIAAAASCMIPEVCWHPATHSCHQSSSWPVWPTRVVADKGHAHGNHQVLHACPQASTAVCQMFGVCVWP